jgi:transketolase
MADSNINRIVSMAKRMRRNILDISFACNGSAHLGGGLSMVEIMAVLYGAVLRFRAGEPEWEDRDRFILSKGHGVLGYYPALLEAGFISKETFETFKKNDSDLIAHPVMNLKLGIESSNGSLGHGLSLGVGLAWAAKQKGKRHQIYVMMGDGECNEGSVWEAAMSAAHYSLNNLTAIIDFNKLQSDGASEKVLNSDGLPDKWRAFRWNTIEVDGHDIPQLLEAFALGRESSGPTAIVAHTVKGKGVSFMENNNDWHHNRLTKATYEQALAEIGGN